MEEGLLCAWACGSARRVCAWVGAVAHGALGVVGLTLRYGCGCGALASSQELPYKLFQRNIACTERQDGSLEVCQAIVTQQRSQKVIIIGKGGERIATMQQDAEDAISKALQRPVELELVVVVANKRDRRRYL